MGSGRSDQLRTGTSMRGLRRTVVALFTLVAFYPAVATAQDDDGGFHGWFGTDWSFEDGPTQPEDDFGYDLGLDYDDWFAQELGDVDREWFAGKVGADRYGLGVDYNTYFDEVRREVEFQYVYSVLSKDNLGTAVDAGKRVLDVLGGNWLTGAAGSSGLSLLCKASPRMCSQVGKLAATLMKNTATQAIIFTVSSAVLVKLYTSDAISNSVLRDIVTERQKAGLPVLSNDPGVLRSIELERDLRASELMPAYDYRFKY